MYMSNRSGISGSECDLSVLSPDPMARAFVLPPALLLVFTLSAQYTATVKTTVTKTETLGWKKWSDKECMINYPSSWTNEGSMGTGALAIFFAPSDTVGGVRERLKVMSIDAKGKTMDELMAAMEAQNSLGVADLKKVSSSVEGEKGYMELQGTLDGQPVKLKRELSLHGDKAWILSYVAPASRFDDALYLADAMFMSFAVK